MKKYIAFFCLSLAVYASEGSKAIVANDDCIESLENEVIGLIYKGSVSDTPMIDMTGKINKTFKRRCDETNTSLDTLSPSAQKRECVKKLEDEIIQLMQSSSANGDKEELIRFLIQNISKNFEKCKALKDTQ